MIDAGSRLSAQITMVNEVLRAFAAVDFVGPAEPAGSPAAGSAGPAVAAGTLAPERSEARTGDLPPVASGKETGTGEPNPDRSLAGLRPPAMRYAATHPPAEPSSSASGPDARATMTPRVAGPGASPEATRAASAPPPDEALDVAWTGVSDPGTGRADLDASPGRAGASRTVGAAVPLLATRGAEGADRPWEEPAPAVATPPDPQGPRPRMDPDVLSASDAVAAEPAAHVGSLALRDDVGPRPTKASAEAETRWPERATEDVRDDARAMRPRDAVDALPLIRHGAAADIDLRFLADDAAASALGSGARDAAGAAAALIFNAAMIPGWPPPRPFDMPDAEGLLTRLLNSPHLGGPEEEMAGNLGERVGVPALAGTLMGLLRRMSRARRLRALLGLMALMDTIETVIEAVEAELLDLSRARNEGDDDWAEAGTRRQLTA